MYMSGLIAIGCIVPPLLIVWRSRHETRWLAYVRYIVAVLIVWLVVLEAVSHETWLRVREARVRGDIDSVIADTGPNATALVLGWIPGVTYAVLLGVSRQFWLRLSQRKQSQTAV